MKQLSYSNDPSLKAMMIEEAKMHLAQDRLIKGTYEEGEGESFRGCAVGCAIESLNRRLGKSMSHNSHASMADALGIPVAICRLLDSLFEALPAEDAMQWPLKVYEAIPVGKDLSLVVSRLMHWLLVDDATGVIRYAKTERTRSSIESVGALYARRLAGDEPSRGEWADAAAADAAAAYAAYAAADAAADAAAAYAAYAAADAAAAAAYAAYAADYAAYADAAADAAAAYAAYAADYAAARRSSRIKQSEKLLELLRNT